MKNIFKKGISLMLSLVIMMTILPMNSFASEEQDVNINSDDVSLKATNSVGAVVMDLAESDGEQTTNQEYYISDLYIYNGYANVELETREEAKLVVAIYESEEFQMVGSGTTIVAAESKSAKVKIDCDNWPEYYYVKAFLLSTDDSSALCPEHNCFYYTEEYEEFLSKTIYDFDEEEVINLDDDATNNFIVLADGARTIEATDKNNILVSADTENGIYIIDNPDSEMKSLKSDNVLYYIYGDGESDSVILCVDKIEQENSQITIYAKNAAVEDMLQYARIERNVVTADDEYVHPENFEAYSQATAKNTKGLSANLVNIPEVTVGPSFKLPVGNEDDVVHGEVELKAEVTFKLHFSLELKFKFILPYVESYIDSKIAIKFEATFNIEAKGEKKGTIADLPSISIPVFTGVAVEGDTKLVYEFSAAIIISFTASKEFGGTYKTGEGSTKIDESEGFFEPNFTSEIEVKIGLSVDVALELLEVFEMGGTVEFGIKGKAEPWSYEMSFDVKHLCPVCVSGEISLYYVMELKITVGVDEIFGYNINWIYEILKIDLFSAEVPLFEFYVTNITGKYEWHKGTCPHKAYKVYFTVQDINGNPISGAVVGTLIADSSGKTSEFFENNKTHTVNVSATDYVSQDKSFEINDKSIKVDITLLKENEEQPDNPGEEPGDGGDEGGQLGEISWNYNELTKTLTISGTGNMDNYTGFSKAPWLQHKYEMQTIVVEDGVTSIGDYAFAQCTKVTDLSLPDSIINIGYAAFYGCSSINEIIIGDNVKVVDDYSFFNCNSADTLMLGSSVDEIGAFAFAQCEHLFEVVVPKSVGTVEKGAFKACYAMTYIEFENSSCSIADYEETICENATIYGLANSTASDYASKYNRTFVTVSPATYMLLYNANAIPSLLTNSIKYTTSRSNAIAGEEYVLIVLTNHSDISGFDSEDLLYIDQKTATENGGISFDYIPRTNSQCVAYIIGKGSNSTIEQTIVTPGVSTDDYEFGIQDPSRTEIRNKDGIILHANVEGAPAGSYVVWTSNNSNFDEDADGNNLTIIAKNKGWTTFTATLYDADGNVLGTDSVEMYSKSGFFDKIGGFFRSLFGGTKIYEN